MSCTCPQRTISKEALSLATIRFRTVEEVGTQPTETFRKRTEYRDPSMDPVTDAKPNNVEIRVFFSGDGFRPDFWLNPPRCSRSDWRQDTSAILILIARMRFVYVKKERSDLLPANVPSGKRHIRSEGYA